MKPHLPYPFRKTDKDKNAALERLSKKRYSRAEFCCICPRLGRSVKSTLLEVEDSALNGYCLSCVQIYEGLCYLRNEAELVELGFDLVEIKYTLKGVYISPGFRKRLSDPHHTFELFSAAGCQTSQEVRAYCTSAVPFASFPTGNMACEQLVQQKRQIHASSVFSMASRAFETGSPLATTTYQTQKLAQSVF